ncbi:unnamed protein product [Paramecium pentaurelia]|uniref:Uncharacterized protein n=1 Tax=Paramecium pentaurelia TaxID=43138 RepID=A0A8S1XLG6_9CILI|nr:unnamed protein product [Paramecium pentaurelia]
MHKLPSFVTILQMGLRCLRQRGNDVFIYILGNKIDLEQDSKKQAQAKDNELGAQFYEVSAKNATNVLEFFKKLQNDLLGDLVLQTHNQQQQQQQFVYQYIILYNKMKFSN